MESFEFSTPRNSRQFHRREINDIYNIFSEFRAWLFQGTYKRQVKVCLVVTGLIAAIYFLASGIKSSHKVISNASKLDDSIYDLPTSIKIQASKQTSSGKNQKQQQTNAKTVEEILGIVKKLEESINTSKKQSALLSSKKQVDLFDRKNSELSLKLNEFTKAQNERVNNLQISVNEMVKWTKKAVSKLNTKIDIVKELTSQQTGKTTTGTRNEGCSSKNISNMNRCKNGGTCIATGASGFKCICLKQFTGKNCELDVDECSKYSGTSLGCQNNAKCVNYYGGYRCDCAPSYFGIHCTETRNDCSVASNDALCGQGKCIPSIASSYPSDSASNIVGFTCACDQGWTKDPRGSNPACTLDLNECEIKPGKSPPCSTNPPVECENLPGSFMCNECPRGYSGDGRTCFDINECLTNNGNCSTSPLVECFNEIGGRRCGKCPPGFSGNGETCTRIGACNDLNQDTRSKCHPQAKCIELSSVSTTAKLCVCNPPLIGDGIGELGCRMPTTSSASTSLPSNNSLIKNRCNSAVGRNKCKNNGECIETEDGFNFECICESKFTGLYCQKLKLICGETYTTSRGSILFPASGFDSLIETSKIFASGNSQTRAFACKWTIKVSPNKNIKLTFKPLPVKFSTVSVSTYAKNNSRKLYSTITEPKNILILDSFQQSTYKSFKKRISCLSKTNNSIEELQVFGVANNIICVTNSYVYENGNFDYASHGQTIYQNKPKKYTKRLTDTFDTFSLISESDKFDFEYLLSSSKQTKQTLGFILEWQSVLPVCGTDIYSTEGSIASPNYPESYQNEELKCSFFLRSPENYKLKLKISQLNLRPSTSFQGESPVSTQATAKTTAYQDDDVCYGDQLIIYDTFNGIDKNKELFQECASDIKKRKQITSKRGNNINEQQYIEIISSSSTVEVVFTSTKQQLYQDSQKTSDTFNPNKYLFYISYERIVGQTSCSGQFNASEAIIRSFDYEPATKASTSLISTNTNQDTFGKLTIEDNFQYQTQCEYEIKPDIASSMPNQFKIMIVGIEMPIQTQSNGEIQSKVSLPTSLRCRRSRLSFYSANPSRVSSARLLRTFCAGDYFGIESWRSSTKVTNEISRDKNPTTPLPIIQSQIGNSMLYALYQADALSFLKSQSSISASKIGGFKLRYATVCESELSVAGLGENKTGEISLMFTENGAASLASRDCSVNVIAPQHFSLSLSLTLTIQINGLVNKLSDNCLFKVTIFDATNHESRYRKKQMPRTNNNKTAPVGQFADKFSKDSQEPKRFELCFSNNQRPLDYDSNWNNVKVVLSMTDDAERLLSSERDTVKSISVTIKAQAEESCGGVISGPPNYGSIELKASQSISSISQYPLTQNRYERLHQFGLVSEQCAWIIRNDIVGENGVGGAIRMRFSNLDELRSEVNTRLSDYFQWYTSTNVQNKTTPVDNDDGNSSSSSSSSTQATGYSSSSEMMRDCASIFSHAIEMHEPETNATRLFCPTEFLTLNTSANSLTTQDNSVYIRLVSLEQQQQVQDNQKESPKIDPNKWAGRLKPLQTPIHIKYQLADREVCGGLMIMDSGYVRSPGYPYGYPANSRCVWRLQAASNWQRQLRLNFTHFNLENQVSCYFDYLEIRNGPAPDSPLIGRFCDSQLNGKILVSHTSAIYLRFVSDFHMSHSGFELRFDAANAECGGYLTAASGQIDSPNYPQPYAHSSSCRWTIETQLSTRIELQVEDLNLSVAGAGAVPLTDNSSSDYLEIFDGNAELASRSLTRGRLSEMYELLAKTSGSKQLNSTSNKLLVVFSSDAWLEGRGFRLTYKAICAEIVIEGSRGVIESPGYPNSYPRLANCNWLIKAPMGSNLSFALAGLELEKDKSRVWSDKVGRFTKVKQGTGFIFISKDIKSNTGLRCERDNLEIRSLNVFETNINNNISLSFNQTAQSLSNYISKYSFDMLRYKIDNTNSRKLNLRKYNLSSTILAKSFCGQLNDLHEDEKHFTLNSSVALISFTSDSSIQLSGFRLEWQAIHKCGGFYKSDDYDAAIEFNEITDISPPTRTSTGSAALLPVECLWFIEDADPLLASSSTVTPLSIQLKLDMSLASNVESQACDDAYLEVYDGIRFNEKQLKQRFCNSKANLDLILVNGEATLKFVTKHTRQLNRRFVVSINRPITSRRQTGVCLGIPNNIELIGSYGVWLGQLQTNNDNQQQQLQQQSVRCSTFIDLPRQIDERVMIQLEQIEAPFLNIRKQQVSYVDASGNPVDVPSNNLFIELTDKYASTDLNNDNDRCMKNSSYIQMSSLYGNHDTYLCGRYARDNDLGDSKKRSLIVYQDYDLVLYIKQALRDDKLRLRLKYGKLCGNVRTLNPSKILRLVTPNYPQRPQWTSADSDDDDDEALVVNKEKRREIVSRNVCIWQVKIGQRQQDSSNIQMKVQIIDFHESPRTSSIISDLVGRKKLTSGPVINTTRTSGSGPGSGSGSGSGSGFADPKMSENDADIENSDNEVENDPMFTSLVDNNLTDCLRVLETNQVSLEQRYFNLSSIDANPSLKLKLCRSSQLKSKIGISQNRLNNFLVSSGSVLTFVTSGELAMQLHVSSVSESCNSEQRSMHGSLASPNYPQAYEPDIDCFYTIVGSPSARVKLTFSDFDLPLPQIAPVDSSDIATSSSTADENLTDKEAFQEALPSCDNVDHIEIRRLPAAKQPQYAKILEAFNVENDESRQVMTRKMLKHEIARNFFTKYSHPFSSTSPSLVKGVAIDKLFADAELIGKYCGVNAPKINPNLARDELIIRFRSYSQTRSSGSAGSEQVVSNKTTNSFSNRGFFINYKLLFGGNIIVSSVKSELRDENTIDESNGLIASPLFPIDRLNGASIIWKLQVPSDSLIEFKLLQLNLGSLDEPCADSLQFFDGLSATSSLQLGYSLCGMLTLKSMTSQQQIAEAFDPKVQQSLTHKIVTSSNVALIKFNNFKSVGSFLVSWSLVPAISPKTNKQHVSLEPLKDIFLDKSVKVNGLSISSGNISTTTGIRVVGDINNNDNCIHPEIQFDSRIPLANLSNVLITFPHNFTVSHSFISLMASQNQLIAPRVSQQWYSLSNEITTIKRNRFDNDRDESENGDEAKDENDDSFADVITCEWVLSSRPGTSIKLDLLDFNIDRFASACIKMNKLEILVAQTSGSVPGNFDEDKTSSSEASASTSYTYSQASKEQVKWKKLAQLCGRGSNLRPLTSLESSNAIKLRYFFLTPVMPNNGFVAKLSVACGGTFTMSSETHSIVLTDKQTLQYHQSVDNLGGGGNCVWRLSARPGRKLRVKIVKLSMLSRSKMMSGTTSGEECLNSDYISIFDGKLDNGDEEQLVDVSRDKKDKLPESKFCNPRATNSYPEASKQINIKESTSGIVTIKYNQILTNKERKDLFLKAKSSYQTIDELRSIFNITIEEISQVCSDEYELKSNNIDDNSLSIQSESESSSSDNSSSSLADNHNIVDLMSPNYPKLPLHEVSCSWHLFTKQNLNIRLDLNPISPDSNIVQQQSNTDYYYSSSQTSSTTNCLQASVSVYDGATPLSPILGSFCLPTVPLSLMSSGRHLLVKYSYYAPNSRQYPSMATGQQQYDTSLVPANVLFKARASISECGGQYHVSHSGLTLNWRGIVSKMSRAQFSSMSTLGTYSSQSKNDNYANNVDCSYYLFALNKNYNLKISFDFLNLSMNPTNSDCSVGDYIEVRDLSLPESGISLQEEEERENASDELDFRDGFESATPSISNLASSGRIIGKYCGGKSLSQSEYIMSTNSAVVIRFKSDSSNVARGWQLNAKLVPHSSICKDGLVYVGFSRDKGSTVFEDHFEQSASSSILKSNASLQSPNLASGFAGSRRCRWYLISPIGSTIKLTFIETMKLPKNSELSYSSDSRVFIRRWRLESSDSLKSQFPELFSDAKAEFGRQSSEFDDSQVSRKELSIESSGNFLTLEYAATNAKAKQGFSASISVLPNNAKCGGMVLASNKVADLSTQSIKQTDSEDKANSKNFYNSDNDDEGNFEDNDDDYSNSFLSIRSAEYTKLLSTNRIKTNNFGLMQNSSSKLERCNWQFMSSSMKRYNSYSSFLVLSTLEIETSSRMNFINDISNDKRYISSYYWQPVLSKDENSIRSSCGDSLVLVHMKNWPLISMCGNITKTRRYIHLSSSPLIGVYIQFTGKNAAISTPLDSSTNFYRGLDAYFYERICSKQKDMKNGAKVLKSHANYPQTSYQTQVCVWNSLGFNSEYQLYFDSVNFRPPSNNNLNDNKLVIQQTGICDVENDDTLDYIEIRQNSLNSRPITRYCATNLPPTHVNDSLTFYEEITIVFVAGIRQMSRGIERFDDKKDTISSGKSFGWIIKFELLNSNSDGATSSFCARHPSHDSTSKPSLSSMILTEGGRGPVGRYPPNAHCVWTIEAPKMHHIEFKFKQNSFDIESSRQRNNNCSSTDYIQLDELLSYDEITPTTSNNNSLVVLSKLNSFKADNYKLIGRFCGSNKPPKNVPLVSETSSVRLIFHSNAQIEGSGFELEYKIVCGTVTRLPAATASSTSSLKSSGVLDIDSKLYDWSMINGTKRWFTSQSDRRFHYEMAKYGCNYTIELADDAVYTPTSSSHILMKFLSLDLSTQDSYEDNGDNTLYQADDSYQASSDDLTGSSLPKSFLSACDDRNSAKVFITSVSKTSSQAVSYGPFCGSSKRRGIKSQRASSPQQLPEPMLLYRSVTIHHFLSLSSGTIDKRVQELKEPYFGRMRLSYELLDCGRGSASPLMLNLNFTTGILKPFSSTSSYLPNMDCEWLIVAPDNFVVEIEFEFVDLEACNECQCDYVNVRDASLISNNNNRKYSTGRLLATLCGKKTNPRQLTTIKGTSNALLVSFHSDAGMQGRGFSLMARKTLGQHQGCGGLIKLLPSSVDVGGLISLPDNDLAVESLDCWWLLAQSSLVPLSKQKDIELSIVWQKIKLLGTNCPQTFIEIRDSFGSLIANLCDLAIRSANLTDIELQVLRPFVAKATPTLSVFYHKDTGNAKFGKLGNRNVLRYKLVDTFCGGLVALPNSSASLTSSNVAMIESPKLDDDENSLRCTWHFVEPGFNASKAWQQAGTSATTTDESSTTQNSFQELAVFDSNFFIDCDNGDYLELRLESSSYFWQANSQSSDESPSTSAIRLCGFNRPPPFFVSHSFKLTFAATGIRKATTSAQKNNSQLATKRSQFKLKLLSSSAALGSASSCRLDFDSAPFGTIDVKKLLASQMKAQVFNLSARPSSFSFPSAPVTQVIGCKFIIKAPNDKQKIALFFTDFQVLGEAAAAASLNPFANNPKLSDDRCQQNGRLDVYTNNKNNNRVLLAQLCGISTIQSSIYTQSSQIELDLRAIQADIYLNYATSDSNLQAGAAPTYLLGGPAGTLSSPQYPLRLTSLSLITNEQLDLKTNVNSSQVVYYSILNIGMHKLRITWIDISIGNKQVMDQQQQRLDNNISGGKSIEYCDGNYVSVYANDQNDKFDESGAKVYCGKYANVVFDSPIGKDVFIKLSVNRQNIGNGFKLSYQMLLSDDESFNRASGNRQALATSFAPLSSLPSSQFQYQSAYGSVDDLIDWLVMSSKASLQSQQSNRRQPSR